MTPTERCKHIKKRHALKRQEHDVDEILELKKEAATLKEAQKIVAIADTPPTNASDNDNEPMPAAAGLAFGGPASICNKKQKQK